MKRHLSLLITGGLDFRQLGDAALRAGRWLGRAAEDLREAHLRAAEERRQREAAEDFAYDKALTRFEARFAEARAKHVGGIDFDAAGKEIDEEITRGPYAIADYLRPTVEMHYAMVRELVSEVGFPALDSRRIRKRLKPIADAAVGDLNRDVFGQFDLYYLELNRAGALVFEGTWVDEHVHEYVRNSWYDGRRYIETEYDRRYIGVRSGYDYGAYNPTFV